jgi:Mrp family chromosome partitioning ATPase
VLGSVDGTHLVVLTGDTRKDDLKVAIAAVRASGARLLGCVLQSAGTVAVSGAATTSTPEAGA